MTQSLLQTIQRGKTKQPPRIILYGLEGIGKSSFAANFPKPVFIQTEDGLAQIDCAKFPLAKSARQAFEYLKALATEPNEFETIVIDTLDWLERLIWDEICSEHNVDAIEKLSYGRGYNFALTIWRSFVNILSELHRQGKIVLLVAHAVAEDYSDPEVSALKRFTPRLHKTARSLLSEYVDVVLLATRQYGAAKGDQDNPRVVRTEPSPFQVAKSRYDIPAEMPLDAVVVLDAIRQAQQ